MTIVEPNSLATSAIRGEEINDNNSRRIVNFPSYLCLINFKSISYHVYLSVTAKLLYSLPFATCNLKFA